MNKENKNVFAEKYGKKVQKAKEIESSQEKKQKKNQYKHRAGDWVCNVCNNHNYSFRKVCNRCKSQTKQLNLQQQLFMQYNQNYNCNIQQIHYQQYYYYQQQQQQKQNISRQPFREIKVEKSQAWNSLVDDEISLAFKEEISDEEYKDCSVINKTFKFLELD